MSALLLMKLRAQPTSSMNLQYGAGSTASQRGKCGGVPVVQGEARKSARSCLCRLGRQVVESVRPAADQESCWIPSACMHLTLSATCTLPGILVGWYYAMVMTLEYLSETDLKGEPPCPFIVEAASTWSP